MGSPVRSAVADNSIVAPFADMTMDEFVALVAANPVSHFKFNAAGDVVEMAAMYVHGWVQSVIATELNIWLRTGTLPGYGAPTDIVFDLGDWRSRPDVVLSPIQGKVIVTEAPLLAVEIRSDSNTWPELREKAARYLEHGTQMVWLVDTDKGTLELHRADAPPQTLRGDDPIDGGAVLPGFRLPVSDLFPDPAD